MSLACWSLHSSRPQAHTLSTHSLITHTHDVPHTHPHQHRHTQTQRETERQREREREQCSSPIAGGGPSGVCAHEGDRHDPQLSGQNVRSDAKGGGAASGEPRLASRLRCGRARQAPRAGPGRPCSSDEHRTLSQPPSGGRISGSCRNLFACKRASLSVQSVNLRDSLFLYHVRNEQASCRNSSRTNGNSPLFWWFCLETDTCHSISRTTRSQTLHPGCNTARRTSCDLRNSASCPRSCVVTWRQCCARAQIRCGLASMTPTTSFTPAFKRSLTPRTNSRSVSVASHTQIPCATETYNCTTEIPS